MTTIDNATAKGWHIDVTSTKRLGATKQDVKTRKALGQQPAPIDPRNVTVVSAAQACHAYLCAAAGTTLQPLAL